MSAISTCQGCSYDHGCGGGRRIQAEAASTELRLSSRETRATLSALVVLRPVAPRLGRADRCPGRGLRLLPSPRGPEVPAVLPRCPPHKVRPGAVPFTRTPLSAIVRGESGGQLAGPHSGPRGGGTAPGRSAAPARCRGHHGGRPGSEIGGSALAGAVAPPA